MNKVDFIANNQGKVVKWLDITKAVGLNKASEMKRDGQVKKVEAGWLVG